MNKNARRIFRLCVTVGNLRNSSSSTPRASYTQNSSLCLDANLKDHRCTSRMIKTGDNDILQALSMARTEDELIDIIKTYHSSLKFQHLLKALKMFDIIHRNKTTVDSSLIPKTDVYELCKVLSSDVKSLSGDDAVLMLRVLGYLNVPANSSISQSLMEHIKQSLNTISIESLMDFNVQLMHLETSPLSEALKIAVPIVLTSRLSSNILNTNDVQDRKVESIFFCNKSTTDHERIQFVVDSIYKQGRNMTVTQAMNILGKLSNFTYFPHNYQDVLQNLQHVFTDNLKQLSYEQITYILNKMYKIKKFSKIEFLDACGNAVIVQNVKFHGGVGILKLFCHLDYMHIPLVDYLMDKYIQNTDVLLKCNTNTLMNFVICVAGINYKPMSWNRMQANILEVLKSRNYIGATKLLPFALGLALFDCFDPDIIEKVFSENFLEAEVRRNQYRTHRNLLILYQSIQTLCLIPVGKSPPKHILEDAIQTNVRMTKNSSILPALEKAMGGSQYVISNLKTKIGHSIEHTVVLRKGGYAVALNLLSEDGKNECKPVTYIEDLPLPSESQVIMVTAMPAEAYTINSHRLKGTSVLALKTLEKQTGHSIISINLGIWDTLKEHQKIPHLMQAIRLKCDYLSETENVS